MYCGHRILLVAGQSEIRDQKSEIRNQKSEPETMNPKP